MAKSKYEDRTRRQIAADEAKEKGLFGAIGSYLSGDFPRSESMDDPQGRSNRRRKGMDILKQREAEGKRRAAELRKKTEQEIRKNEEARKERVRAREQAKIDRQAASVSGRALNADEKKAIADMKRRERLARQDSAEASTGVLRSSANPPAKPKAPAAKTPASKPPATKTPAPKAKDTKTTPAPTGDKKYNVGVSKGGVSFKESFRFHRNKALKGGPKTFTWNGKQYTTELKKPVKKMGGGMMKSKMASKGGARGGRRAMGMKNGGFPDLTGDGKVTQADILKGRGVAKKKAGGMMKSKGYAKGGAVKKKGMAKGGATSRKPTKPRGVGAALRGFGKAGR